MIVSTLITLLQEMQRDNGNLAVVVALDGDANSPEYEIARIEALPLEIVDGETHNRTITLTLGGFYVRNAI